MRNRFILFLTVIAICFACNKHEQLNGYTRDDSGFYFKLLAIGDGNDHPQPEDVCVVDAVMRTQSDSVFWDTKHDAANGLYISLTAKCLSGSCQNHYLQMAEGDSVSFLIKPSVFFREYFDTIVPAFCANDSLIKIDVKLNQIISKAEYKALKENSVSEEAEQDTELKELQLIDNYLKQNYKRINADGYGLYHLEKTTTTNQPVMAGKRIKVAFQGNFLDGKPIDAKEHVIEFVYGTPDQVVEGLNIVIGTLKMGETTKIIVPSRLAFGELGSSNSSVPPYTPIVYNIKIIDIK